MRRQATRSCTSTDLRVNAPEKTEKPLTVEIRNNKVVFKQKFASLEKQSETLQGRFPCLLVY